MKTNKKIAFRAHYKNENWQTLDIYDKDGSAYESISRMCKAHDWDEAEVAKDVDLALSGQETPIRWIAETGIGMQIVYTEYRLSC